MILKNKVTMKRSLVLEFVESSVWAIRPEKYEAIQDALARRIDSKEINLAEIEAAIGTDFNASDSGAVIQAGNAIIPIQGTIARRMNLFSKISGGVSTELVMKEIKSALDNPDVHSILLDIDSPGGTVEGTKELADLIYASRGKKPIKAYINGTGASAAYWIASVADEVIAYDTAQVGSIGVVTAHVDYSQAYKDQGVKKTYVTGGKYKRIANEAEPLSKEGLGYIQSRIDYYYSMFVEAVARNRGVSAETVLKDMADGRIFIGAEALKAGLVDKLGLISEALKKEDAVAPHSGVHSEADEHSFNKEETSMDLNELKAQHPGLVEAITAEARVGYVSADEHSALKDEKDALSEQVSSLSEESKRLSKELAVADDKMAAGVATRIMDEILSESNVASSLHSKVKGMLDFRSYLKEGDKFVEGSDSVSAFAEAFKAEVSDWEESLKGHATVGLSVSKEDGTGTEDADAEYAKSLARKHVGPIRSDNI